MAYRALSTMLSTMGCLLLLAACSYDVAQGGRTGTRASVEGPSGVNSQLNSAEAADPPPTSPAPTPTSAPPAIPTTPPPPGDDPGPPPAGCTGITKDADGFFTRTTGKGPYVGYVPKTYDGSPMRLVVGMHGCGDDAYNFATWGVNPYSTRANQDWIGISVGGETGGDKCWNQADEPTVLAAIDDISKCFYVHKHKVVLAGYSSGGELAYGIGMRQTSRFAGILAECTALSSAGDRDTLLAGAAYKIPVAHTAHTGDGVFPIATVRADWTATASAGFPLSKREIAGGHEGETADWADWLHARAVNWRSP